MAICIGPNALAVSRKWIAEVSVSRGACNRRAAETCVGALLGRMGLHTCYYCACRTPPGSLLSHIRGSTLVLLILKYILLITWQHHSSSSCISTWRFSFVLSFFLSLPHTSPFLFIPFFTPFAHILYFFRVYWLAMCWVCRGFRY